MRRIPRLCLLLLRIAHPRAPPRARKAPLRVGALHVDGVHVADVSAAVADEGGAPLHSMRVFLESGDAGRATATRALGNAAYLRALEHVELRAPIYDPCVRGSGGGSGGGARRGAGWALGGAGEGVAHAVGVARVASGCCWRG